MRNFEQEVVDRVAFIRQLVADAGVRGIVYNNSGGKDASLVGILCKMACPDTVGLILPCGVKRNYDRDRADALTVGAKYDIAQREVDLLPVRDALLHGLREAGLSNAGISKASAGIAGASAYILESIAEKSEPSTDTSESGADAFTAQANISIAPRLRMVAVYMVANTENRLVAGTGNLSEGHMGYFTKWGDGAFDFNPIADLTVTEVFAFLRYLGAPSSIIDKAPSAGLYEGQTDEGEMGVTYAALDTYLATGEATEADKKIIDRHHRASAHKRIPPILYGNPK